MSQGTGTAKLWLCWWSAACQLSICRKKTHRFSVFTLVYNQLYRLSTTSSFCCSPDHDNHDICGLLWRCLHFEVNSSTRWGAFPLLKKTPQTFHQTSTKLYIQWNFTSAIPINESLVLKAILSLHTNLCGRCNLQSLHFFLMRNAHENLMRTVLPCYPLHWASQLGRPGGEENLLTKLGPCSPLLTMITWGATYDSYMIHMITVISLSSIDSLEIRNGINRIASPKFWHIVWPCLTQAT